MNPLKQGLKPSLGIVECVLKDMIKEVNPLKQGLKLFLIIDAITHQ